jgi:hypothetical protein
MRKTCLGLFLIFILSGCTKPTRPPAIHRDVDVGNEEQLRRVGYLEQSASLSQSDESKRIVLFDASISLETDEPDSIHKKLIDLAKKYEGYVLVSGTIETSIRVPANRLKDAIGDIEKLGKVVNKNITGQDVTEEYRDLEIRLDNAQKARQRYLELLSKAENVEAALKVEKELERLNTEIDLLKGRLNRLTHLSQYATISVTTENKVKLGILGYFSYGIYKAVAWLFVR